MSRHPRRPSLVDLSRLVHDGIVVVLALAVVLAAVLIVLHHLNGGSPR